MAAKTLDLDTFLEPGSECRVATFERGNLHGRDT